MEHNEYITVIFHKEQDGWHSYTKYDTDIKLKAAMDFCTHIANATKTLNKTCKTNTRLN